MKRFTSLQILLSVVFLLIFVQIVSAESTATNDAPNWKLVGTYTWDFV